MSLAVCYTNESQQIKVLKVPVCKLPSLEAEFHCCHSNTHRQCKVHSIVRQARSLRQYAIRIISCQHNIGTYISLRLMRPLRQTLDVSLSTFSYPYVTPYYQEYILLVLYKLLFLSTGLGVAERLVKASPKVSFPKQSVLYIYILILLFSLSLCGCRYSILLSREGAEKPATPFLPSFMSK